MRSAAVVVVVAVVVLEVVGQRHNRLELTMVQSGPFTGHIHKVSLNACADHTLLRRTARRRRRWRRRTRCQVKPRPLDEMSGLR